VTLDAPATGGERVRHWGGPVVGGFYLSMGGVHLGLVAADPQTYRHFADGGLFDFVREGWHDIFMSQPAAFGLSLMAAETVLGVFLLLGGRWATVGWTGAVVFHVLLMLFGFGFWLWCVPAIAALAHLARKDTTTIWGGTAQPLSCAGLERLPGMAEYILRER
jgi:hypothetical protein